MSGLLPVAPDAACLESDPASAKPAFGLMAYLQLDSAPITRLHERDSERLKDSVRVSRIETIDRRLGPGLVHQVLVLWADFGDWTPRPSAMNSRSSQFHLRRRTRDSAIRSSIHAFDGAGVFAGHKLDAAPFRSNRTTGKGRDAALTPEPTQVRRRASSASNDPEFGVKRPRRAAGGDGCP